jgi:hypothetical protein
MEKGLYDKWVSNTQRRRKDYNPEYGKNRFKKYESEVITMSQLEGVFVMLFCGLSLSFLVFIIEICPSARIQKLMQMIGYHKS